MTDASGATLRAEFSAVPFNRYVGLTLAGVEPGHVEMTLAPKPEFAQEHGVVHGGILAALADTAAVYLVQPLLAEGERMASIEFKVNFLAPAWPGKGELRASARPVRIGRRVAVCEATVHQNDSLLLTGLFTYMRFTPSPAG